MKGIQARFVGVELYFDDLACIIHEVSSPKSKDALKGL